MNTKQLRALLRPDPGRINLRKGLRAGVVTPSVLAVVIAVTDNQEIGLFAAFATFAALAMTDFGGSRAYMGVAYVGFAVVGAALVVVGTVVSEHVALAAVVMFVVAAALLFTKVYGALAAAAGSALTLSFVLAALVQASSDQVPDRTAGWLIGSLTAAVAAQVLWPADRRRAWGRHAAGVCRMLAAQLRGEPEPASAADHLAGLHELASGPARPAGAGRTDTARARLLGVLDTAVALARRGALRPDGELAAVTAASLERSASMLEGASPQGSSDDLLAVRHHELASVISDARGRPPAEILAEASATFDPRILSHLAASVEANAAVISGHEPDSALEAEGADLDRRGGLGRRVRAIAASESGWRGVAVRDALRGAVALAVALVVADTIRVEHGFWVVLGALTVLRSSAASTGLTALEAVLGSVIGLVVSAVLLITTGGSSVALWVALPVAVFLAAYTPAGIHFVVGQASFALFVVVLFDLMQPHGISTAVVRVETVAIGATTASLVAAVLWPRGGRAVLCDAAAGLYQVAAEQIRHLTDLATGRGEPMGPELLAARHRASTVGAAAASEGIRNNITGEVWAGILGPPETTRMAAQGLGWAGSVNPPGRRCRPAEEVLERRCGEVADRFAATAEQLLAGDGEIPPGAAPVSSELQQALEECGGRDEAAAMEALRLGWTLCWTEVLEENLARSAPAVATATALRTRSWWR